MSYGIDRHSEYSLYDILENDYEPGDDFHFEYYGFHIMPHGGGKYVAQLDGHVGRVLTFNNDDYDDVLELVADLNELVIELNAIEYANKEEGYPNEELVEWAGPIMTRNEEKVEENPGLYYLMPENPPTF